MYMRKLVRLYTEVLHGVVRISVERKSKKIYKDSESGGEIYYFHYEEIQYLEARDKKIILHVNKYEISFYSSLQKLEKILPDYFIRCHRSYIVNFMFIQKADLIKW